MSSSPAPPAEHDTDYWHERVRAEAKAALDCDDPRIAAIHVELATHCLRMAKQSPPAATGPSAFDFAAEKS